MAHAMADTIPAKPLQKIAGQVPSRRWVEVLLIVLVFFAIAGEPVPHNNESHYIGRLMHYWCPPWGAGDLFLESAEAHYVFVWTFGWLTKWLSLTATAWVGRLLAWSLLAWAWQRLSWRLLPVPLASVLSAALWVTLTERMHLAGEWVVVSFEAKCFAYLCVLVALRELVDGRWNRVWLALGAASGFHALVGGWSVVVCGGIWFVEQFSNRSGLVKSLCTMIPGLVGGGLLALLGVVPALALTWNESPQLVAEANRIYVFERLPHHLALLTLPTVEIVERLTRHGLLIVVFLALVRANRDIFRDEFNELRRVTRFAYGAILLAAVGFTIELAFWSEPLLAASLLKFYWFRLTDFAVPLAVALHAVALVAAGLAARRAWATWGLAAAIAFPAWHIAAVAWPRAENPIPPADSRMRDFIAWVDVCEWVAENSPPDALFITPRTSHSFKWRTGRPEVATWKDIPQDAASIVEWFDRLQALYTIEVAGGRQTLDSVGELGTARVLALAQQYGADYVIADQRDPLALPIVYPNAKHPNNEYVIYSVPH
jgi:hypothetical protein